MTTPNLFAVSRRVAGLFLLSCVVFACATPPRQLEKKSPELRKLWGDGLYSAIETPDKVEIFPVNPDKSAGGDFRVVGFAVSPTGSALSADRQKALSAALLDPKTYNFAYAKKAPLFPEFGFRFAKAGKDYWVLYDRSRLELAFFDGEKEVMLEDCDSIRDLLKSLTDLIETNGGKHE